MQVLEQVTFRLGTDDSQAFVAANQAVTDWARQQPGFVSRVLSEAEDGMWTDIVVWAGQTEAEAAAAEMNRIMERFPAMMMIDPDTIVMRHGAIRMTA